MRDQPPPWWKDLVFWCLVGLIGSIVLVGHPALQRYVPNSEPATPNIVYGPTEPLYGVLVGKHPGEIVKALVFRLPMPSPLGGADRGTSRAVSPL